MLPVPEIGLNLIGKDRVRGWVDLHGGYNNRVWRVFGHGEAWIVKSFGSSWLRENEVAAIRHLGPLGLAPASCYAQSATVLVWPDDGFSAAVGIDQGLARAMGYALRRIHGTAPLLQTEDNADWRLVGRIGAAASTSSQYQAASYGPVHGDARLGNALVDRAGRFVRFADFEEFGLGDQAADLVLCLVETACDFPACAVEAVNWVVAGYTAVGKGRLTELQDIAIRQGLAEAAFTELSRWAEGNESSDLIDRYRAGKTAAMRAIESIPMGRFA